MEDNQLIGVVLASRLFFKKPLNAFIITPVAVHPKHQRRGVGQVLLRFSIDELRRNGVELLMTYGDPSYYCKVGFNPVSTEDIQPPLKLSMPFGWIGQMLDGSALRTNAGRCACVKALDDPRYRSNCPPKPLFTTMLIGVQLGLNPPSCLGLFTKGIAIVVFGDFLPRKNIKNIR